MSRSHKRLVIKDNYGSSYKPWAKRAASKAVRRFRGYIPNGGSYKRIFNSWNICDFVSDGRFDPWPWQDHKTFLGRDNQYRIYK